MGKMVPGTIRIGIGGWTYAPWRGSFYPDELAQKRELEYVSRQLTSIEINGTYYGSQKPASFAKWRDETPDGFVFSVKAPRFVMNREVLASADSTIARFLTSGVMELKDKLGPINWQFLPTKKFDPADFNAFLKLLPREAGGRALRHVVEVRHDSFRCPEFIALLREHGVAVGIQTPARAKTVSGSIRSCGSGHSHHDTPWMIGRMIAPSARMMLLASSTPSKDSENYVF